MEKLNFSSSNDKIILTVTNEMEKYRKRRRRKGRFFKNKAVHFFMNDTQQLFMDFSMIT